MRLVFIHGIHEEHKAPAALRHNWENALLSAWNSAGLAKPRYTLEMPCYGNLLARLAARARGAVRDIASRSGLSGLLTRIEHAVIHEIAKANGIGDAKLSDSLARDVLRSEFAECESVQGIFRFFERDIPGFGQFLLSFTRQVDAYLTSPHIRAAVDDIVRPSLLDRPTVIVAHSLGSVIAYRLLRQAARRADVPLLVTLGSPLGICTIKQHLNPPALAVPSAVKSWLNATDEKDCVALHSHLDRETFVDGIENVDDVRHVQNDPHEIADYLGNATVARRIHAALSRGAASTPQGRGAVLRARVASPRICARPRRTPG